MLCKSYSSEVTVNLFINMVFILIAAALVLSQSYTLVQAAPSVEACPPDSFLAEDICKCDPDSCVKPPCLSVLTLAVNGSDLPGFCCPTYDCVDCDNDTLIDGKCPCAPGAVLDDMNQCKCVDEEKHLVDGECVCDPRQCKLPPLCDRKSVPIAVDEGCCKKTICQPCPGDSESTHQESDLIDDHCVCLPCKNDCGNNRTVVVKKYGSGLPGNCCDLYECKKVEEVKGCYVDDVLYENGVEWLTLDDRQRCKCQNGLSLCSNTEERSRSCFSHDKIYKHMENWTKEDGCTYCTCIDGEEKCISHFCEAKESQIEKNSTQPCLKEEPKKTECRPLMNCSKTCENGFKVNKKGCEICKCAYMKYTEDILDRYNITLKELLMIIKDYTKQRSSTTTTTFATPLLDSVSNEAPVVTGKNARLFEDLAMSSTTTEPSVVPTDKDTGYWNIALPILALLSLGCVAFIIVVAMCIYKSRRKSSMDLSHCHYETVNNNNTIKKTELL